MPIAKIIAALGNPGTAHAKQRHNVGFMLADKIVADHGPSDWRTQSRAEIATLRLDDEDILLVKPQSYMNLSGEPIGELMRFYKLPPQDLWVLHDELDLPLAQVRHKLGGGHAGHNGLKNITAHIGADFHRLRFGIAHPRNKVGDKVSDKAAGQADVSAHVLGDFTADEKPLVEKQIAYISENIVAILHGDLKL